METKCYLCKHDFTTEKYPSIILPCGTQCCMECSYDMLVSDNKCKHCNMDITRVIKDIDLAGELGISDDCNIEMKPTNNTNVSPTTQPSTTNTVGATTINNTQNGSNVRYVVAPCMFFLVAILLIIIIGTTKK